MAHNSADALDSLDDDWLFTTDADVQSGYDDSVLHPGDVESWPAPNTGRDDRNQLGRGALKPSSHSKGPFDAYAFLRREEPRSDNAQGFGRTNRSGRHTDAGAFTGAQNQLNAGDQLTPGGKTLRSPDNRWILRNRSGIVEIVGPGGQRWRLPPSNIATLAMQTDGNLVAYDTAKNPLWSSSTQIPGAWLELNNSGDILIYDYGGTSKWDNVHGGETKGGLLHSIGSVVSGVAKGVGGAVAGIARPIGSLVTSPAHLVSDIATGKNVFNSLKDTVKRDIGSAQAIAPYAQAVLSVVPGVGQGVNAAIAAGSALAHGQNITDALVNGVKNLVPGGPLAQQALSSAYNLAKGQNVIAAVADAARSQLPPGPAQTAFDTGLALAHGANLQQSLTSSALSVAKDSGMSLLQDTVSKLGPTVSRALDNSGPNIGTAVTAATNMARGVVSTPVRMAAQAILQNPDLRSLPIDQLAQQLNVPIITARSAVASLVDSVSRAGGPSVPHMSMAHDLESRLPTRTTFDQAMADFGSRAAGPQFSHNARRVIQWTRGPAGYVSTVTEARGLDSSGTAYIVDPGDSMSKIATKVVGSSSRVKELIAANPQVKDPNVIQVGQRLNLPTSWQKSVQAGPSPAPIGPAVVVSSPVATGNPAQPVAQVSTTHAQIKKGSTGPDVKLWQSIIGVTADGIFGSGTDTATRAWQSAHGLTADGIVGPKTWAAAVSAPNVSVSPVPTGPVTTVVTYVVKSGDSPYKIAQAFTGNGGRYTELAATNPSSSVAILAGTIYPGQVLTIPPSWGSAPNASPVPVAPVAIPQVVTNLPQVLPTVLDNLPQIAPGLQPQVQPVAYTPGTSTTMTPQGPVTATTDPSGSTVSVSQPPITGSGGGSSNALIIGAVVILGGILFLGKGSAGKL